MNNKLLPGWIYYILGILVVVFLILYFSINAFPDWGSVFLNIAGTIIGILITIGFVDAISYRYNEKDVKQKIKGEMVDILNELYNILAIFYNEIENSILIFNNERLNRIAKLKSYSELLLNKNVNKDKLKIIISDSHSAEFYLLRYKQIYSGVDDFWRLYNNRLSSKESIKVMDLRFKLSRIIKDFQMLEGIKVGLAIVNINFDFQSIDGHLNNFMEELKNLSQTLNELSKLIGAK